MVSEPSTLFWNFLTAAVDSSALVGCHGPPHNDGQDASEPAGLVCQSGGILDTDGMSVALVRGLLLMTVL